MNNSEAWLSHLAENGYRLTKPRQVVVNIMATSERVLNPLDVFEIGREIYPRLGLVTVYRTLEKLEELGLIQRVHQPSGCQAFVSASSGHEHLLICLVCGRIEFFKGDEGMAALMEAVEKSSGYQVREHWLQLLGVCTDCQPQGN
jgi:Fe2+ or Zn2+ uptake regulation protein